MGIMASSIGYASVYGPLPMGGPVQTVSEDLDSANSVHRLAGEASLRTNVKLACREEGIVYETLGPIQRLFLTHYRCPTCKLLPLNYVNVEHPKRVRCGMCGTQISFRNSGKYGKLRKKIAFMLKRGENTYNVQ